MSKIKSLGNVSESRCNNAFNRYDDLEYQYQYDDIIYIGNKLIEEYNLSSSTKPIIFISPLGQDRDSEGIKIEASNLLRKAQSNLENEQKAVGIFNTGGNHWIAYLLFKIEDSIQCLYKDSLGTKRNDFEQIFEEDFYKDKDYVDSSIRLINTEVEQILEFEPLIDSTHQHVSCGIFALKNMLVLAGINSSIQFESVLQFFTPGNTEESYTHSIVVARKELAKKYFGAKIEELKADYVRKIVVDHHNTEANKLAEVIDISEREIDVRSLLQNPLEYSYGINYPVADKKFLINKLQKLGIKYKEIDNVFIIKPMAFRIGANEKINNLVTIIQSNNSDFNPAQEINHSSFTTLIFLQCSVESKLKPLAIEILQNYDIAVPDSFKVTPSLEILPEPIIENVSGNIEEIRAIVEQVVKSKESNTYKIEKLQEIESTQYKPLIKELAYKTDSNETSNLIIILSDLGKLHIELGGLSGEVKYYTDAAVLYNYVITIMNADKSLQKFPTVLASLEQGVFPYSQLNIIQSKLLKAVKGIEVDSIKEKRTKIIDKNSIDQISHKELLAELRTKIKAKVTEIEEVRSANSKVETREYIEISRTIFEEIATEMKHYLALLYKEAKEILEVPPCQYAIIGLGSMALKQMTPYSDLEFAIIIEKYTPEIVTYFRNLSHLVHFKMINLGETIIPTSKYGVDMSHLVHQAVNFDLGGKTPLGRVDKDKPYDLIGTIDWLIHYVRNDQNKAIHIDKNLPYILEKVCYIYGNEQLVTAYKAEVQKFLQQDYETTEKEYHGLKNYQVRALKVLKEGAIEINYLQKGNSELKDVSFKGDLLKLNPVFSDRAEGKLFDVKQEIYRLPDRMLYNLGMYYGIDGDSAWDTVDKLYKQGIINLEAANNLQMAITFATTLRLTTYSHNNCQRDDMFTYHLALEHLSEEERERYTEKTFYIEDTKVLHDFYYVMLRVIEMVKGLCDAESRESIEELLRQDKLYDDNNYNKAMVHARFLEYDRALECMEAAKANNPEDLMLLYDLYFLYRKTSKLEKIDEIMENIIKIQLYSRMHGNGNIGGDDLSIANSYANFALANQAQGKLDQAIKCQTLALNVQNKIYESNLNNADIAASYNNLANMYEAQGKYELAIFYQKKSLDIHLEIFNHDSNHFEIAGNYDSLGNIYLDIEKSDNAVECYTKALNIRLKIYGNHPNHPEIAASYNNLGNAYRSQSKYDLALIYFQHALQIHLKLYEYNPEHHGTAIIYNSLGNVYTTLKQYEKAINCYNKALEIDHKVYKYIPNHPHLACDYYTLGAYYKDIGNVSKAIECHYTALRMRHEAYHTNPNHPEVASSYTALGSMLEYTAAIQYHNKALTIYKECYKQNLNHPNIAGVYHDLGIVFSQNGEHIKAAEYCELAREIFLKAYDTNPNNINIINVCNSLGIIYDDMGMQYKDNTKFDQAIRYYQEALDIRLNIYQDTPHLDLVRSYSNLMRVYKNSDQRDKMSECIKKALDITTKLHSDNITTPQDTFINNNLPSPSLKQITDEETIATPYNQLQMLELPDDNTNTANDYNNLGADYFQKNQYQEAIIYFNKALTLPTTSPQENLQQVVSCNYLGMVYLATKQYDKALECYGRALNIQNNHNQPHTAASYCGLGMAYFSQHKYQQSIEYYLKALDIQQKIHTSSSDYMHIAGTYHKLGDAYDQSGNYAAAIDCFQKAIFPNPSFLIFYKLGLSLLRNGNFELSKDYLEQALETPNIYIFPQKVQDVQKLLSCNLVQLGNIALLEGNVEKAIMYYNEINEKYTNINSSDFISLQLSHSAVAYENYALLAAINCQLVLLKVDSKLCHGNHYHNLACFYAAIDNIELANETFIKALNHREVKGSLYAEYAQFLIINKENKALDIKTHLISKYLYTAMSSDNTEGLEYGILEKNSICTILKSIIEQENKAVRVNPKILAYYLLIKYPEYIFENDNINTLLKSLHDYCDRLQDEVSFKLLADCYNNIDNEESVILAGLISLENNW
ncbi:MULTISPECIES: tetratricopeptide repeat protein [unclassified Rickettsia]|uniref:tetratricopeptide repeat protein n=1 Tax=unclassified Rickettsia TaxID=114295 RepID=UPI003133059E